jgi:uncharacterized membrane protein YebE (DUF533 family)
MKNKKTWLIIAAIAVVGGVGYWMWKKNQAKKAEEKVATK